MTNDISRRLCQHDTGKVKSTKNYKPFKLIHAEIAKDRKDARQLEKFFKSGYGREIVKQLVDNLS